MTLNVGANSSRSMYQLNCLHEPFISKWLFDVEIFFRMFSLYGRQEAIKKMLEVPLSLWVDRGDSSVKPTYIFKLWLDLYRIHKRYKTSR